MIRPWFRQAAVPWKTTVTQTRASGENRVSTKLGVLQTSSGLAWPGSRLVSRAYQPSAAASASIAAWSKCQDRTGLPAGLRVIVVRRYALTRRLAAIAVTRAATASGGGGNPVPAGPASPPTPPLALPSFRPPALLSPP